MTKRQQISSLWTGLAFNHFYRYYMEVDDPAFRGRPKDLWHQLVAIIGPCEEACRENY